MGAESVIDRVDGTSGYVRFLLAEAPYIRSALYARGYSFDETYRVNAYPSYVGSDFHLDLLHVEQWFDTLSVNDQRLIEDWVDNTEVRPVYGKAEMRHINTLLKRLRK